VSQDLGNQGGADDGTERSPRTVSKASFGCLAWTLFAVLMAAELAVASGVSRGLGVRLYEGWIAGAVLLNLVLSRVAADRILKLLGHSRSGKTVETRGRTVALAEGEVGDDEVVEVRCPPSFITGLGVTCLVFCLVIILILAATSPDRVKGIGWAHGVV